MSLTFQSVFKAVLVHWKRDGELLVCSWVWLCAGSYCLLGNPNLGSPAPLGPKPCCKLPDFNKLS